MQQECKRRPPPIGCVDVLINTVHMLSCKSIHWTVDTNDTVQSSTGMVCWTYPFLRLMSFAVWLLLANTWLGNCFVRFIVVSHSPCTVPLTCAQCCWSFYLKSSLLEDLYRVTITKFAVTFPSVVFFKLIYLIFLFLVFLVALLSNTIFKV